MIKEYISLLNEKQKVLYEILEYTKSKTFEESEDNVDRIEYYLDNREKMFETLSSIENKIKNIKINDAKNKDVVSIIKKNDEIIKNIVKLDEKNKKTIETILNRLKNNIKSVKDMSKVNNRYLGTYQNIVEGSSFDSFR